jgi:hypothetical protein
MLLSHTERGGFEMFEQEDKIEYTDINFSIDEYLARTRSSEIQKREGILLLPKDNWRQTGESIFMPETFNFAKWARKNTMVSNSVAVAETETTKVADLRSHDFWLPLAYLFSDVPLQIYLGLVANYIYDRLKGALKNEEPIVDLEVYIEDKKKGKVRRFSYHGSCNGLQQVIKRIDVNELLDG